MTKQLAKWQLSAALVIALLAYGLVGPHAALSALAGSISVWSGLLLAMLSMRQARLAMGGRDVSAGGALWVLLRAEAIKIAVIATLLWLVFKVYGANLVPLALISGLAVAALLSGAGLMRTEKT